MKKTAIIHSLGCIQARTFCSVFLLMPQSNLKWWEKQIRETAVSNSVNIKSSNVSELAEGWTECRGLALGRNTAFSLLLLYWSYTGTQFLTSHARLLADPDLFLRLGLTKKNNKNFFKPYSMERVSSPSLSELVTLQQCSERSFLLIEQ